MQEAVIKRAKELLADGTVNRVVGWKAGEFAYDTTPAVFTSAEELDAGFIYNDFCAPNLSKYLVKESRKEGKLLVFLKPCDTYSFNQLLKEHRILRDNVYIIGVECTGKVDADTVKSKGIKGITGMESDGETVTIHTLYGDKTMPKTETLGDKCKTCKSKKHVIFDEMIGNDGEVNTDGARFELIEKLEAMTPDERYNFWRGELSKCIRCNACRNVCPACTCENCVFDNPNSGIAQRAATDSFEENMFQADAQTAANVQEFVLRTFPFTSSTASTSRISTNSTAIIRQVRISRPVLLLTLTHSATANPTLYIKEEVTNNVQASYR